MGTTSLSLGISGHTIALAAEATRAAQFAAEQLAYYLAVITGRRFPIADDSSGTLKLCVDPGWSETPGAFAVAVQETGVRFTGQSDLGLLHGVYWFLERKCGCRWLSDFEGGEVVPRRVNLTVATGEDRCIPAMTHRAFTNFPDIDGRTVQMVDWMCKNRFNRFMVFANVEGAFEAYREVLKPHLELRGMSVEMGHHSFKYWLPPGEFFAEHPEWFAEIDGERVTNGQVCTSSPGVAETMARRINAFLAENPEIDMVGLWPNDGYGWCTCPQCVALEEQGPSVVYTEHSRRTDTYVAFVNRVAELVAAEHPDRRLSALAYVNYIDPPSIDLAPNVALCYAPFQRCFKHPLNAPEHCTRPNAMYADLMDRWAARCPGGMYLFCYLMLIDMCSMPYDITTMLGPNFRWLAEHGCDGYVMEFVPEEWGLYGINAHTIGELSWNPELDVEARVEEHYEHVYGPAAREMLGFRRAFIARFIEPGPCVHHYDLTYTTRASRDLLLPALEHLGRARALAAAADKRYSEAVERMQIGVGLLMRMGEWQRALREASGASGDKRAVLSRRARDAGEALTGWAAEHGDRNAIFAPRIEMIVNRAHEGLGE